VQQLHLVGFTTDHRGLIFSVRRGAESGGYVVNLDASVLAAVDELQKLQSEGRAAGGRAAASASESALSVREVQARLRRGRSIDQVAREAGVETSWVERFAAPVFAEQTEIIRATRAARLVKQRVGESSAPLGESVYRTLADRGVTDAPDALDKAWRARQLSENVWLVTFKYTYRGRNAEAAWEYDAGDSSVKARGRLGASLGFRDGTMRPAPEPALRTAEPVEKKPARDKAPAKTTSSSKQAGGTTTRPKKTTKKPATASARGVAAARRVATAQMVSEAERATRRNAAVARKAATKPVVLPARAVEAEPDVGPEPLADDVTVTPLPADAPVDEPLDWTADVDRRWDDPKIAVDDDGVLRRDSRAEPEPEPESEPEPEPEVESEPKVELELKVEPEPEVESEPKVASEVEEPKSGSEPRIALRVKARPPKRREPLRVKRVQPVEPAPAPDDEYDDDDESSEGVGDRVKVRVRTPPPALDPEPTTNGPVFHPELAQPASELSPYTPPNMGTGPAEPLWIPQPIEPLPRRWRRRPIRRR
jgi:hypothetical protein